MLTPETVVVSRSYTTVWPPRITGVSPEEGVLPPQVSGLDQLPDFTLVMVPKRDKVSVGAQPIAVLTMDCFLAMVEDVKAIPAAVNEVLRMNFLLELVFIIIGGDSTLFV